MKKVFRHEDNQRYWDRRWTEAGRDSDRFDDLSVYPIAYSQMVMENPSLQAVELGAGLGRLLKHYHYSGHNIVGLERSEVAVNMLRAENPAIDIRAGDVRSLPQADSLFDVVLAFGLYHNLEEGMDLALAETARVLKKGGRFCISMRPDNIEMNLNEWYWKWQQRDRRTENPQFHKWLVGGREFRQILSGHGLHTDQVHRARNVSLLYRIPWLRDTSHSEAERRSKGYRLNALGRSLDRLLVALMPSQFCNVLVFIGRKAA